jgi:predicted neuraminidase
VDGDENQYSAMKLTSDLTNWTQSNVTHSNYLVQPSVVRTVPNKEYILAFFRDRRAEHIYSASSTDEGITWTEPKKTILPNNNAAIQATVLASGNVALVFNPTNKARNIIRIAISKDGGKTWPHYRDLEHTTSNEQEIEKEVEYSYPSILQTPDGFIHVSYTYNRDTIKYVKFKETWVYNQV